MKKLNHTWRNQKDVPAQASNKSASSKEEPESVHETATRRRLGRFALVSRRAPVVKKIQLINVAETLDLSVQNTFSDSTSEHGSLPVSFISSGSWKVDNDLLAEMDKVEAAMRCDEQTVQLEKNTGNKSTIASNWCKSSNSNTIKITESSTLSSGAGSKRKAVKQTFPRVLKEDASSAGSIVHSELRPTRHDNVRTGVNSPTSSPIDKRPKLNSRPPLHRAVVAQKTTAKQTTNLSVHQNGSSFPTPEGRIYSRRKCRESKEEIENDISFSPLLDTPNIMSESSDEENEFSAKSGLRSRSKPSMRNNTDKSSRINSKSKIPLNVVETPKRSSAGKRQSPKNLMSPEVKVSKSTRSKMIPRDESCLRENKMTVNELKGGKVSAAKHTSPKSSSLRLKSNSSETKQRHQDNEVIESQPSHASITPSTSSPAATTSGHGITSASVNTSVNVSLTEDKRLLKSWGLPQPVLAAYQKQGVTTMFEWQAECLLSPSALNGGNLIYSAPTSAGKTLVAEILVLKRVLETRKKALIILPFVSVAREKMFSLQRLYQDAGIRVGGYMGSHSPAGGLSALDVAVCTIEKGNGLVNRMMEDGRIDDIGVVVVDELHMVGDSHRGYLLELMLTKLEFLSLRREPDQRLQIIGMSATLPNLEVLAKWLRAALYRTDFRPVPLSEHIKVDNRLYDAELVPRGEVPPRFISPDDADHMLALCLETVTSSHSVLVFCPTKNWCEKLCETIARKFYHITHAQNAASATEQDTKGTASSHNRLTLNKAGLRDSLEQLRRCPVGVDPMLGRCLINGVAYHHAGLTFDERDIIEGAFREGSVRVLVATSTLSSGVNLPARRVIIRTPMFHGQLIDLLTFKQMSGRAGRKGVDTEGESILICKPSEKMKGRSLLQSELPPVESCLYFDAESGLSRSLKRAILEVVVSGVTSSPEDVMSYIKCTLLSASMDDGKASGTTAASSSGSCTASLIDNCIAFLQDNEFVSMQTVKKEDGTECKKFFPTQLGSAILASSLSPDEGLLVFAELQKARRSFVLETELHVIYLVTPVYSTDTAASIDWYQYYTLWESLTPAERRVADLVGVREAFIAQAIGGRINKKTEAQRKAVAVHHRFYTSLVLNTLVREVPLMEVAAKFNLNKGQLQSLQQSAATYTGMLTVFCQRLGWHNLEMILSRFQRRLSMGVQHELVDLVRISALTASSARMLYNAGYHTVADVARAEAIEVEELFKTAVPFQSDKKQEGETDWERKERQKAKCIWLTGRKGMTELDAAREIIHEAKGIVQGDLGVKDIAWNSKSCETSSESNSDSEADGDVNDVETVAGRENQNKGCEDTIQNHNTGDSNEMESNESCATPQNSGRVMIRSERSVPTSKSDTHDEVTSAGASNFTRIKSKRLGNETTPSIKNKKCLSSDATSATNCVPDGPGLRSRGTAEQDCGNTNGRKRVVGKGLNDTNTEGGSYTQRKGSGERTGRRKSCSKRRKSFVERNRSKGNETSFFGQVVVTPPPGLRPLVDESNKSRLVDDTSDEGHASRRDTQNKVINHGKDTSLQASSQAANGNSSCSNHSTEGGRSDVGDTRINTWLNKSSYSKQADVGTVGKQNPDVDSQSFMNKDPKSDVITSNRDRTEEALLIAECLQQDESTTNTTRDNGRPLPVQKSLKVVDSNTAVAAVMTEGSESRDESREVFVDSSKNTSVVSDNLSFSESFILDTQTAALINADCDEYLTSAQNSVVTDDVPDLDNSNKRSDKGDASITSRKELPLSLRATRNSTKKTSFKPNGVRDAGQRKDIVSNARNQCVSRGRELGEGNEGVSNVANNSVSDISSESVSFFETSVHQGGHGSNGDRDAEQNMEHCTTVDVHNMKTGNIAATSKKIEPGQESDEDKLDCEDEPDSLLVASCYERVSNFDEGMLECSGYDDLGIESSLSELNVMRNTGEVVSSTNLRQTRVEAINPKSNQIGRALNSVKTASSVVSHSYRAYDSRFHHISDTQCTDDSLLAAVDLCGLTPLSSQRGNNTVASATKGHNSAILPGVSESSKDKADDNNDVEIICRRGGQNASKKPDVAEWLHPSDSNMFLSDSLSASLVDQVFAQCDLSSIKTSSPCSTNNSNNDGSKHCKADKAINNQLLQHTTPVSKHLRTERTTGHVDISPVLWDNPNSHTNSPNTSSCHDGSDCVPPTPPCEASSHASPLKPAFFSPMTNRKKPGGPSTPSRLMSEEQSICTRASAKKLPWVSHGETSASSPGSDIIVENRNGNGTMKMKLKKSGESDVNKDLFSNETAQASSRPTPDPVDEPFINDDMDDDCDKVPQAVVIDNDDRSPITSQSQLLTQQSFTIIDVCAHQDLFQMFLEEWQSQLSFSLALACEKTPPAGKGKSPTGIGCRFNKKKSSRHAQPAANAPSGLPIPNTDIQLVGLAVTWEHRDAYYLSLMDASHTDKESDLDDSLAEPSLCESISLQDRLNAVITHLQPRADGRPQTAQIYDTKTAYTTLAKALGVNLAKCQDPRVADWLREPGSRLKNLHRMVTTYLPSELALLEEVGGSSSYQSLGFDVKSRVSARLRACTESILTRKLMAEYGHLLGEQELWQAFEGTEMPALITLCRMELHGFGISLTELESQKSLMTAKLESIEQTAYKMAGHVFSLTSLDDIAKILYLELKLPLNGDPEAVPHLPARGTRQRRTVGGTSKEILQKLNKFHPLPALILEWRRISSALTMSLYALQRTARHCDRLAMTRVFGDCQIFSATGRVAMAEPNIQNIPKDFCVELKDLELHGECSTSCNQVLTQSVSMRKMFVPFSGGVILSADYSQLELRIIAHLSGDVKLRRILNSQGGDVFKLIAAQFKSMDVEEVTPKDRQQAKQVCYGMLYGIGPKALGEQIGVCENEATVFMETFKSTYPGIRKYLRETVEFCQKNGYVKTLFNRRRYLPSIKHTNPHARAQAERQAVNTSVQGSAADLVKTAMTNIDLRLMDMFPDCHVTHSQRRRRRMGDVCTSEDAWLGRKPPQGGYFLLQLHDELIYEVNARHLDAVARLVRREMEGACRLCVRMPVKVNVGPSWGQLEEYNFDPK